MQRYLVVLAVLSWLVVCGCQMASAQNEAELYDRIEKSKREATQAEWELWRGIARTIRERDEREAKLPAAEREKLVEARKATAVAKAEELRKTVKATAEQPETIEAKTRQRHSASEIEAFFRKGLGSGTTKHKSYTADELVRKFGEPTKRGIAGTTEMWTFACKDGTVLARFTIRSAGKKIRLEIASVDTGKKSPDKSKATETAAQMLEVGELEVVSVRLADETTRDYIVNVPALRKLGAHYGDSYDDLGFPK